MVRFLLTAVGVVLLAVAVVFAVSDIARSLAQDVTATTTLAEALLSVGLSAGAAVNQPEAAIDVIAAVSDWPAAITIGSVAILLLYLGRSRGRTPNRVAR